MSTDNKELDFTSIAKALAIDYFSIFYINLDTDEYIEYTSSEELGPLGAKTFAKDFFGTSKRNIIQRVYHEDVEKLLKEFSKENVLKELEHNKTFTLKYRLLIDGKPQYVSMKATRVHEHGDYLVIGVNNIDAQVKREKESLTYESIATALSKDYFSIFYVDLKTERFKEFASSDDYIELGLEQEGEHFFEVSKKNALKVIYHEDLIEFLTQFTRENIVKKLSENPTFIMRYRIAANGEIKHVSMKVSKLIGDDDHFVVGVNNIDKEIKFQEKSVTHSAISEALAADYFCIYYINMTNKEYVVYSADEQYKALGLVEDGKDFFNTFKRNVLRLIHHDDVDIFLSEFSEDNISQRLNKNGKFTLKFRIMMDGEPKYVSLKASTMLDKSNKNIVIGINNIDAQIKKEQELNLTREKAFKDSLTGVKNKHSYEDEKELLDAKIKGKTVKEFAIGVCDVNGLKRINDEWGHQAGDTYIKKASDFICGAFVHSPVYRIGGDEFVVILGDRDYLHKEKIINDFIQDNIDRLDSENEPTIAFGLAELNESDTSFDDVFKRADKAMYENKLALKNLKK